MQLTFLTLNLCGYKYWPKRQPKVVDFINFTNSDLVCLQEVRYDSSISSFCQSDLINGQLAQPYNYTQTTVTRFYAPSVGEPYREGLAILSKYPITTSEALALEKAPDDKHTRIVQQATIVVDDQPLNLTNVHFSSNQYSVSQLTELLDILSKRNQTSIIVGDFNIFDIVEQLKLYEQKYIASTQCKPYISYPLQNQTLDYMLLPKAWRFQTIDTFEGLSDHAGVLFTVSHLT